MIMVGPGTGIAPFRGFLQERRARGHPAANWLFFGDQHRGARTSTTATISRTWSRDGFLNRLDLAFSRDQRDRVYVQHRMLEHGAQLWRGCRTARTSTSAVTQAGWPRTSTTRCCEIARCTASSTRTAALAYEKRLTAEKRYVRDVY